MSSQEHLPTVPGSGAVPAQCHQRSLRGRTLCQATGRVQAGSKQDAGSSRSRMVWRKPMVANTEMAGAGVGAACQSNNLREGHNSSHGSWAGAVQSSP